MHKGTHRMKKIFTLLLVLILLPLTAQAFEFREGTHYKIIKATATEKPEVSEFFSFYCGHCFGFESFIGKLKAQLPENVAFKKNHVDFLGREMGPMLTRAYAAAELFQVEDEFSALVFDQIMKQHKNVDGEEGILEIFEKAGIPKKDAENALLSFPVNGLASQMKRNTETFKIMGVPTLIVNGKYKVEAGSVKSEQELLDLVNYLSKRTN